MEILNSHKSLPAVAPDLPPISNFEKRKYKNLDEYKADILMGIQSEKQTLRTLQIILDDNTLKKSVEKYAVIDFYSKKYRLKCEVKGRRNKSTTYKTTMIGVNKLEEAKCLAKRKYTILFFFDFEDGLYYFDYKDWDTITSHYQYEKKMGGTYRRGLREWKPYHYVPCCLLKKADFYKGSICYTKTRKRIIVRKKEKSIENTKIEKV